MHGPTSMHPSQSNIGVSNQYSSDKPNVNSMSLTQQNRPTASGKKVIKTIPMRSPHSLNRQM